MKAAKALFGLTASLAVVLVAPESVADRLDEAFARARALCAKMTLEEKAGELMVYDYREFGADRRTVYRQHVDRNEIGALMRVRSAKETRRLQEYKMAHSRLGIPLIVHEDIECGWSTTLPIEMAMACSWDDALVEQGEAVAAREATAIGIQLTYSPQVDVANDPRWGRVGGTLGEDPYLASRMAAACVRGFQGRTPDDLADGKHVISCVKHYVGYASLQAGRDYRHLDFSRRELFETHLPPFRAAVEAGALSVMNAYTVFEGVPCNFNRYLLTDVLRKDLGFRGQLVTDWTTLAFSVDEGAATDLEDAAVRGLAAGVDMDMIARAYLLLPKLVREGKVAEKDVDVAVVRSLSLKYLTGLFDDPYRFCDLEREQSELFSERNQREVLELTRECIVLLKNEGGLLPLSKGVRVGLTGTGSDDVVTLRGGMFKANPYTGGEDDGSLFTNRGEPLSLRAAMAKRWGENLVFKPIDLTQMARGGAGIPDADVVVLTIGEPTHYTGERCGRAAIELPDSELENLRVLKRAGKKVVSVVFAGRPFIMNELVLLSDAVLFAWYPGAMGGEALAELLCGEANPSAKLCENVPRHVGQIPLSYREKRTFIPCSYADYPSTPLFPFGFGLSYTTFAYAQPQVEKAVVRPDEPVKVSVRVKNTGAVRGREVVQLYVRDDVASVLPRERELKDFASVWLDPGEEREVSFVLGESAFALYDANLNRVVEPGTFTVYVGGDSTATNAVQVRVAETDVQTEMAGRTEARTWRAPDGGLFRYRWHEPKQVAAGVKYPLVILMHGAGERGTNNVAQLQWGAKPIFDFMKDKGDEFFFVAGQVPEGKRWVEVDWGLLAHTMPETPSETMARQVAFLEDLFSKNPSVDRSRIYVTGVSMGGYGTWDLLCRKPEWFAAAMPICGGADVAQAERLKDIPIWTFHGDQDTTVPFARSRAMTAALWACGGKIKYTEYPGVGHGSWIPAYGNRANLEWLFKQTK